LLIVKNIQKRTVNAQLTVVLDESQFAEAIHEEADSGAGGANHLCQGFLADFGNHGLWSPVFAELGEQQQGACQALFAGVEELINQIFLETNVTDQQVGHEHVGKLFLIVKHPHHFFPVNSEYGAGRESCGSGHALWLDCGDALFSHEISHAKQRYGCFLAALGVDRKLDPPLFDIEMALASSPWEKRVWCFSNP
jgi:hypothetical protein